MSKKQSSYNTRKDIFTKEILPISLMIRLVKKEHAICLGNVKNGRGYWIKKDLSSWESLNNKSLLCKAFRDHQVFIEDIDEIKNALMN